MRGAGRFCGLGAAVFSFRPTPASYTSRLSAFCICLCASFKGFLRSSRLARMAAISAVSAAFRMATVAGGYAAGVAGRSFMQVANGARCRLAPARSGMGLSLPIFSCRLRRITGSATSASTSPVRYRGVSVFTTSRCPTITTCGGETRQILRRYVARCPKTAHEPA